MKKSIVLPIVVGLCVLIAGCSSTPDKTEPATPASAPAEPAPAAPPPAEPATPEPPKPAEPTKAEAPKVEPAKSAAPAKNEPKAAAPKETTLGSGLKMTDHKEGQGEAVKTGNRIAVHYTGWLYENGKRGAKFDSSVGKEPFVFTVGSGVIRGWSEGVVGMKPGGKRELIIPSDLAYGPGGAGGVIPPNATLDFEIELLQILQ
jgi:FKBP-type peptidyl-prolyl cis-trans isomerase